MAARKALTVRIPEARLRKIMRARKAKTQSALSNTLLAEEGLGALAEALAAVDKNGERWFEAELYRLKGELTLHQSSVQSLESRVQEEAEACFQQAIEIARRQEAKSLELRAAVSLSRLWR